MIHRPRRSALYLPASNLRALEKAAVAAGGATNHRAGFMIKGDEIRERASDVDA